MAKLRITTKFHAATDHRGSRYIAICGKHTAWACSDDSCSPFQNHAYVATKLMKRLGYQVTLAATSYQNSTVKWEGTK